MAQKNPPDVVENGSVNQTNTPDPAEIPEIEAPSTVPDVVYEVTARKLNLRAGPAKCFPIAAILLAGERLIEFPIPEAIAVDGWIPVFYESACGWVKVEHCRKVEA